MSLSGGIMRGGQPRLTRANYDEIRSLVQWARGVLDLQTLERLGVDRSCHTCDYEWQGKCSVWEREIPEGKADEGCARHQGLGIPF